MQKKRLPSYTELARSQGRRAGFSMIELMVVMSLLMLGSLAMASTMASVHAMREANRNRSLASTALDSAIAEIRATAQQLREQPDWSTAFTDTFLAGNVPGDQFDVVGLTAQAGAASIGSITTVTDETLTDGDLGVDIGMPRDLDNDGDIDNADVTGSARLLPVVVNVAWNGASGNRQMTRGLYVLSY